MQGYVKTLIALIEETTPNPAFGCEIGVWRGHTSMALLKHFPNLVLWCIDPWNIGGNHETMPKTAEQLQIGKQEFIDNTEFAARRRIVVQKESIKALWLVENGLLDFVFIDGCHLYENVKQDVEAWSKKVRLGGLVSGHDYGGKGDRCGWFGVKKAIDEFAKEQGIEIAANDRYVWHYEKA